MLRDWEWVRSFGRPRDLPDERPGRDPIVVVKLKSKKAIIRRSSSLRVGLDALSLDFWKRESGSHSGPMTRNHSKGGVTVKLTALNCTAEVTWHRYFWWESREHYLAKRALFHHKHAVAQLYRRRQGCPHNDVLPNVPDREPYGIPTMLDDVGGVATIVKVGTSQGCWKCRDPKTNRSKMIEFPESFVELLRRRIPDEEGYR